MKLLNSAFFSIKVYRSSQTSMGGIDVKIAHDEDITFLRLGWVGSGMSVNC